MSEIQDPRVALDVAEAMVEEFENYLLQEPLYRQLMVKTAAGDRMPRMSAGTLLETLHNLAYADEVGQLAPEQADRLARLTDTVEQLVNRYMRNYHQKLARELKSQIDSWRWFLQDCRDSPMRCWDEYPFEVRVRNRIALLMDVLGDRVPAEQVTRLQALDLDLRGILVPGEFILDPSRQDCYPKDRYWWLYGHPRGAVT